MISFAGTGVAMGNAEPAVLRLTDLVTADNDSDGAALAMKKWILEE
jgi:hydroxymethylpyrimidine pyrophosphatase-like HAD family hydrolase